MLDYMWLIPILPLAGAVINLLLGVAKVRKGVVTLVGVGSVGAATLVAFGAIWEYLQIPADSDVFAHEKMRAYVDTYFTWINAGDFNATASFQLDPLSVVMLSFVTFVGFLIHLYSVGYMHEESDAGYARYFAYLNLFMFSMLILILGSNLPLMFVGWEGVGLCSYLLIGFYFEKDWCAAAGKKAFVVNRIGDFGFILAIFVTFATFGTAEYTGLFPIAAESGDVAAATVIGLLLFVGAIGKSAQMPLYVWLPDAMAGPTPVSALIHAATMVTAGVYMVARCNVFYRISPVALLVVAIVGGLTAIFAATIGLAQNDIKKVLAYSTVSQLGYMFLGAGALGFIAAIFHVLTHAFFKACLFLGSGSVIHACGGEQDMQKMGGLRKYMPITFWTFMAATLAIAGAPFLAGFFSKDEILAKVFEAGYTGLNHFGWVYLTLYGLALAGAAITAFYMFRLVFMTFFGEFRGSEEAKHHLHESPWTMTVPLIILGALSIVGGYIGIPGKLFGKPELNLFEHFMEPILLPIGNAHAAAAEVTEHTAHHVPLHLEWLLLGGSVVVAAIGALLALRFYWGRRAFQTPQRFAENNPGVYRTVLNKYFVDELYAAVIVKPLFAFSRFCWHAIDTWVIDKAVNLTAFFTELCGDVLRFLQTGNVRNYALSVALGILALAVILW